MLFKAMTVMLWVFAIGMGASLFWASGEVQKAEAEHYMLSKEISREQSRLHVLKAEWHYLNNPEYLEQMAARYLGVENQRDEGRIVVAGDSLPRYVEAVVPSEKPEGLAIMVAQAQIKTEIQNDVEMDKDKESPVVKAELSDEEEFGAVLANWSGGR